LRAQAFQFGLVDIAHAEGDGMTGLGPAGAERATYVSCPDHRDFHGFCPYIDILG
jgi:hypothetical protein